MKEILVALYQFTLVGENYTTHMQNHETDISKLYASLPYFYSAIFVKKNGTIVTPLGGLLVKTNIPQEDIDLHKKIVQLAQTLQPVASLIAQTNTCMIVPINRSDSTLPSESEYDAMATDALLIVGCAGNA